MSDDLYRERARLAAFVASRFPSVLSYADPDEPEWAVLYVDTPEGQLSWHIAPGDVELFDHVLKVTPDDKRAVWDGHDTPTKYERLTDLIKTGEGDVRFQQVHQLRSDLGCVPGGRRT